MIQQRIEDVGLLHATLDGEPQFLQLDAQGFLHIPPAVRVLLQGVQLLCVFGGCGLQLGDTLMLFVERAGQTGDRQAQQAENEGLQGRGFHGRAFGWRGVAGDTLPLSRLRCRKQTERPTSSASNCQAGPASTSSALRSASGPSR